MQKRMEGADEQLMAQPCFHPNSPGWKGCVCPELVLTVIPLLSVQIPSWNVTTGRCHGSPHCSIAPNLLCLQDKHFLGAALPTLATSLERETRLLEWGGCVR